MSKYGLKCILWMLLCLWNALQLTGQSLQPAPWQPGVNPINTLELDQSQLQTYLDQTVSRWNRTGDSRSIRLVLPLPNGQTETFNFWRSEQMEPELMAKFPAIQNYFGQSQEDPRRTVYLTRSRKGVRVLYFDQAGLRYTLQPLHPQLRSYQFVYPEVSGTTARLIDACTAQMHEEDARFTDTQIGKERRGEVKLYRYRLALACTGEYGSYHGNSKEEVLIAMNELLAQVNAIFERELSVHFDLVANNDLLIFLDPETDPYDNDSMEDLLESNKTICNYAIGYPNFDLGHVLATKFGGQAHIGSVCNFSRKAKAFSGLEQPEGYYMGAVFAHELAHQMGAQHTQSNDCNRNLDTALEPGSGSTLMAYAGICAPNVQQLPDDYFHGTSLELIKRKAAQGIVFGCVPGTNTDNLPPVADAGPDIYVPVGTPFRLVGQASDANGDSLSYAWEQVDGWIANDTMELYGPIFRSTPPSASPVREIGGRQDVWETLPIHARKATFRLTVRDYHLGLGGSDYDEMTVHFIDSAGPLNVTTPNSPGQEWSVAVRQTVAWEVAGTAEEPVNCDTVNISLSTDGGQTYPFLLAEGIVNNGSYIIDLPAGISGDQCRIQVSCTTAPIFAVSDHSFAIIDPDMPADTVTTDTIPVPPMDTGNTVIDTIPTVVEDTIVTPQPDTMDYPVVDTTTVIQPDTLPPPVMDTVDTVVDTIPTPPSDTVPDVPMDTIPDNPVDTLPQPPADTVVTPMDTIPHTPADTTAQQDTDPDIITPTDTIITLPQDTTIQVGNPPDDGHPPADDPMQEIELAPNPAGNFILIKITIRNTGPGQFYLINSQGQTIGFLRSRLDAGLNVIRWDLDAYASGMYWLRSIADGRVQVEPLVIKH